MLSPVSVTVDWLQSSCVKSAVTLVIPVWDKTQLLHVLTKLKHSATAENCYWLGILCITIRPEFLFTSFKLVPIWDVCAKSARVPRASVEWVTRRKKGKLRQCSLIAPGEISCDWRIFNEWSYSTEFWWCDQKKIRNILNESTKNTSGNK